MKRDNVLLVALFMFGYTLGNCTYSIAQAQDRSEARVVLEGNVYLPDGGPTWGDKDGGR